MTASARLGAIAESAGGRVAREVVLAGLSRIRHGEIVMRLPGSQRRRFGSRGSGPSATVTVHDDACFLRILGRGEIGLGEAYMDGLWSSDDLATLLEIGARNRTALDLNAQWATKPLRWADRRRHLGRQNTVKQSRSNIAAHYDLSNDLFATFLDETMTYSSAVFEGTDEPLADAQRRKYRALADLAGIRPGDHVLEIGGGWGGFAVFAAEAYSCEVTTITISREQHAFMRDRVASAGLDGRVHPELLDYRHINGRYDAIVSIEMLEAVGADYYATFFETCKRALRPGGCIALQVITVPDRMFERSRDGVNWLQKYIFPGGDIPSLAEIERALAETDLIVTSVRDIGLDYARTLSAWRTRFMERQEDVRRLGFDDRFVRTWEYYLALCEAGFRARLTQDLQIGMERPA